MKPGEQNGPVERFARPGSESSPNAQHGVQAKDDLSGESSNRTIRKTTFVYHDKGCFFMLSDQNTGKTSKNQAKQAPERPIGCSGALFLCLETRKQVYFLLFFRAKKNVKKGTGQEDLNHSLNSIKAFFAYTIRPNA